MKTLITVMLKELAEIFRDRKIIINGLLLSPLLFPILILGMGALAENRAKTQLESELKLPIIGAGAQQQQSAGQVRAALAKIASHIGNAAKFVKASEGVDTVLASLQKIIQDYPGSLREEYVRRWIQSEAARWERAEKTSTPQGGKVER